MRFLHTMLRVQDLDAALRFYVTELGLREVRRRESESPQEARGWRRIPGVRQVLAWLRAGGSWERPETALLRGVDDRLADLVNLLGTRRFFYADQPSIADLGVYGMLFVLRMDAMLGSARMIASRPSLIEFMRRLEEATGG